MATPFNEALKELAKDKPVEQEILAQWAKGRTDSNIALHLTQKFGGQLSDHKQLINEFRRQCQEVLEQSDTTNN